MRTKFLKYTIIIAIIIAACSELLAQTDLRKDTIGEWVSTEGDSISINKIYRVGMSSLLIDNKVEDLGGLNLVSEVRAKAVLNDIKYTLYEMVNTKQVLFESSKRIFVGNFIRSNDTLRFDNKIFIKKQQ